MINVIVVPEKDEFEKDVLVGEVIYINEELGRPNLEGWNAKYIAPFLLREQKVFRIYEILSCIHVKPSYEIYLGNSYIVAADWNNMNQVRRFEYHPLNEFGFTEIKKGFLIPILI